VAKDYWTRGYEYQRINFCPLLKHSNPLSSVSDRLLAHSSPLFSGFDPLLEHSIPLCSDSEPLLVHPNPLSSGSDLSSLEMLIRASVEDATPRDVI